MNPASLDRLRRRESFFRGGCQPAFLGSRRSPIREVDRVTLLFNNHDRLQRKFGSQPRGDLLDNEINPR